MMSKPFHRRSFLLALSFWLAGGQRLRAADVEPIEIAVLPYFSARLLIEAYDPLRAAVETRTGRPTILVTAANFRTFALRTQAGLYGFILTAPHLARLAELDAGYRPLLQWKSPLQGVFSVEKDSPVQALADLRGAKVSTPDPLAAVAMLGEDTLRAAGLTPGETVLLNPQPSHNAALLSVLRGESAAVLTGTRTLDTVDADLRDRLRPIAYTARMPVASVFLAGPRLGQADARSLCDALLAFAASDLGHDFLKRTGYEDIVAVEKDSLAGYDRFLPAIRRLLAGPQP